MLHSFVGFYTHLAIKNRTLAYISYVITAKNRGVNITVCGRSSERKRAWFKVEIAYCAAVVSDESHVLTCSNFKIVNFKALSVKKSGKRCLLCVAKRRKTNTLTVNIIHQYIRTAAIFIYIFKVVKRIDFCAHNRCAGSPFRIKSYAFVSTEGGWNRIYVIDICKPAVKAVACISRCRKIYGRSGSNQYGFGIRAYASAACYEFYRNQSFRSRCAVSFKKISPQGFVFIGVFPLKPLSLDSEFGRFPGSTVFSVWYAEFRFRSVWHCNRVSINITVRSRFFYFRNTVGVG